MTRLAAAALAALAVLENADAIADVAATNPGGRHSAHHALGCREPSDVVKAASHLQPYRCRPIDLRWVRIDNYDVRLGETEMLQVEHPFYGQIHVLKPQEWVSKKYKVNRPLTN